MNQSPNLSRSDYLGSKSTLCVGCGHDQISNHIVSAAFQAKLDPHHVVKVSGIGCSSKLPTYFLGRSFGINSMHGRMAPVATGVAAVKKSLQILGVSGDGDTGSIGMGGFIHMLRRNVKIVYIVANNGVYGLTKGQFSATADRGAQLKGGDVNPFQGVDLCELAISAGCGFVARSFSGDAKQLVPLIQAAFHHSGTALIDVISPCVTFNNHDGSTKSFSHMREHDRVLHEIGLYEESKDIIVDYPEGSSQVLDLGDGAKLILKKIKPEAYDVSDRVQALNFLGNHHSTEEIPTGLFYHNAKLGSFQDLLPEKDLGEMTSEDLKVDSEQWAKMIEEFR